MGTDIHMAVEVRRKGIWRYHTPKTLCRWYTETYDAAAVKRLTDSGWVAKYGPIAVGERSNKWDRCKYRLPEFFTERNYRVFAVLGDVRNGEGFAGVYTHDYIEPISSSRGWPDGMTPQAMRWMSEQHSETWVTLAELEDYDYNIEFTEGGVLEEEEFRRSLAYNIPPHSWSGGISGPDIVVLDPAAFASLFESPIDLLQGKESKPGPNYDPTKRYYINHRWQRNLRESVDTIPDQMIPYLQKLVPKGGTSDDVRLVFDFDS